MTSAAAELALTLGVEAAAMAFGRAREAVVRSWHESVLSKPDMTAEARVAAEYATREAIKQLAAGYVASCTISRILCHEEYRSADYQVKMAREFDGWVVAHDERHPRRQTAEARAASDVCKLEHMLWSWRRTTLSAYQRQQQAAEIEALRPGIGERCLRRKIRIKRNRPS